MIHRPGCASLTTLNRFSPEKRAPMSERCLARRRLISVSVVSERPAEPFSTSLFTSFAFQESLETGASPVATTWPGVREFNRRPDCAASPRSRVALTSVRLGHPSGSLFHVPSPHIVEVGLGSSFYLARPIALSEEQLRPGPHVPPRLNCRLKTSSHDR